MSPGQIGFEAYKESIGGIAFEGTPIPDWNKLHINIQTAWEANAEAILSMNKHDNRIRRETIESNAIKRERKKLVEEKVKIKAKIK